MYLGDGVVRAPSQHLYLVTRMYLGTDGVVVCAKVRMHKRTALAR